MIITSIFRVSAVLVVFTWHAPKNHLFYDLGIFFVSLPAVSVQYFAVFLQDGDDLGSHDKVVQTDGRMWGIKCLG
ncbi:MAG: hypothetical protein CBE00_11995 [Planctomycetaceae bacterium TMED240]|nr:hypothetical protein [Rhodopirellula sp.]OUX04816.1 MAG: hypothetical protein CBE00_11995 [Planctomycetaceae bacterium TMED240]